MKHTKEIYLLILKEVGKEARSTLKAEEVKDIIKTIPYERQESALEAILTDYQELLKDDKEKDVVEERE